MDRTAIATASALFLVLTSCTPADQRTDSLDPTAGERYRADWPADVLAHIDSGNAAMRADADEAALGHFLMAVEKAPDNSAAWFGVYMAHQALGNVAAADSAMTRVRKLAPGASLVHPSGGGDEAEL